MKKFLHSTLLLGAALVCGFSFASCNSNSEPEEEVVTTQLQYTPVQAPQLFAEPLDKRDLTDKQYQEMVTAQNKGAVVLRTLKEVENYFGSKLEENSPLRTIDYSKYSVITATFFVAAPIVKTTLGWAMQSTSKYQRYVFTCQMEYEKGTEDNNLNIFYNVQPTIMVDAISANTYVFTNPMVGIVGGNS